MPIYNIPDTISRARNVKHMFDHVGLDYVFAAHSDIISKRYIHTGPSFNTGTVNTIQVSKFDGSEML